MRFAPTAIPGAFVIDIEPRADERGFFARAWCRREAAAHGIGIDFPQCNISFNARRGTLRGMHWSVPPAAEAKVVRCTRGAVYDVLLDLRPASPAYRRWVAVDLTAENRRAVFIPEGVAHGFQTVTGDSEVFYQMSSAYDPACARGVRWDDRAFAISWPIVAAVVSARDLAYPDFVTTPP